eukprot:Clim_evm32s221 gene=Clim_evmTU32s221
MAIGKALMLAGNVVSVDYAQACNAAEQVVQKHPGMKFDPKDMLPMYFELYRQKKLQMGFVNASGDDAFIATLDGEDFHSVNSFFNWVYREHGIKDSRAPIVYHAIAQAKLATMIEPSGRSHVDLTFKILTDSRTITIQLFDEKSETKDKDGKLVTLKDCAFRRVVENGWIDVVDGSGRNSLSPLTGEFLPDVSFSVLHDKRGIVGYATQGPHTNGSQFYITARPMHWMDTKYVAFGRVIAGNDVLTTILECDSLRERPLENITIESAEVL